jgi:hypothetical protein
MTPNRRKELAGHTIEECYWNGGVLVYIDNKLVTNTSFDNNEHLLKMIESRLATKREILERQFDDSTPEVEYIRTLLDICTLNKLRDAIS